MNLICSHCGKKFNPDKVKKELRIISDKPKIGEVYATCKRCNHDQRIAVFDQAAVDMVIKRQELQKKIRIARKGIDFRKGSFRNKIYQDMVQEDQELKNALTKRIANLTRVIDNGKDLLKR